MADHPRLMRTPLPIVILRVLVWLAYPALLAFAKFSQYIDKLHG